MEELKSLNHVQQSVACALALQMISGDEINITRAGGNHGWPLVSYGCNYGSILDSTSNMLSALGSLGGSGSSNPLSKLADGVLGTAS